MVEIFKDIPDYIKIQSEFWVDKALQQHEVKDAFRIIEEYRNSCLNDKEKEFVDFYFNYRLEKLRNENIND